MALMDVKEAVNAAAPRYAKQKMPKDQAERVVEGAMRLSPHLGKRMVAGKIDGRSVFIRELLPQDLKIEPERLTVPDAMKAASFLGGVVGRPMRARWTWRRAKAGPTNSIATDQSRSRRRPGFGRVWLR
jgi:uncharacterized protein (DUF2252 family)